LQAASDVQPLINKIQITGMRTGLAIKPSTPTEVAFPNLDALDLVLVMTVEPGFGGQSFMSSMMDNVSAIKRRNPTIDIQVDGGFNLQTIDTAAEAGANCIVAAVKGSQGSRSLPGREQPAVLEVYTKPVRKGPKIRV
jgi:ribulose-phosphate 3-epimerase